MSAADPIEADPILAEALEPRELDDRRYGIVLDEPVRVHASIRGAKSPLWPITHQSGERMRRADVEGPQACPRGLRPSFGVAVVTAGVPLPIIAAVLVRRWTSLENVTRSG